MQRFLDQDPCEHSFNHARLNSDGAPDARGTSTSKGFSGGGVALGWGDRHSGMQRMGQVAVERGLLNVKQARAGVLGDERSRYFVPARPNYEDLKKMLAIVISRLLKYLFQITKDPPPRKFKDMPSANS